MILNYQIKPVSIKIFLILFYLIESSDSQTLTKYEPAAGCYIGAFILNDVKVSGQIGKFEQLIGKEHAGYLTYTSVSSPFPKAFVDSCKKYNAFMQLGFEPDSAFRNVIDGPHLRNWAKAAARSGIPIFLRFASEMNGDWVPWFGPPSLYKEKWKLMYNIMKQEAPNVAMVWCPNWRPDIPGDSLRSIMPYYPGDEYVDWVGVNFYMWGLYYDSVMGETHINTLQKLRAVYDKFPNKPVMICEWAAASKEYRGYPPIPKITTSYCTTYMQQLYNSLQSQFPRVKAVFWFDYDSHNINKSDFSLTNDSIVTDSYKNVIQSSHFLTSYNQNVPLISIPFRVLKGFDTLSVDIQCTRAIVEARLFLNGNLIQTLTGSPWKFSFDVNSFSDGEYEIEVRALTTDNLEGRGFQNVEIDNNDDYLSMVIDNSDSLFTGIGGWISTSQPDRYGGDYYVIPANSPAYGEWTFVPQKTRSLKIFVMWSAHPNRSANAKYVIFFSSIDSTIISVDQRSNGGKWNYLGEFPLVVGIPLKVKLLSSSDGYCIADAIRLYQNTTTSVEDSKTFTTRLELFQNYPNPFNSSTVISYELRVSGVVRLKVYDILGREVATLVNEVKEAGVHNSEFRIPHSALSSGVYIYELEARDENGEVSFIDFKKMLLVK
ncbi:MAG: T9SS type A sorting domain-containing protein [Bacteroidetes bacterium]|nr:T9SS type A sorting domain-containing protein [Bacteroidota bacterium]